MPVLENIKPKGYQSASYTPGSWSSLLTQMSSNLTNDAAVINQLTNYLASAATNAISDSLRSSGISSLSAQMNQIQNDWNTINTVFSTPLNTSGDALDTSLDIIDRAEKIVDTLDNLSDYADSLMSAVDNIGNLPSNIESVFSNYSSTLSSLTDFDMSSALDNLPSSVSDSLLNLDIVQDPLVLYQSCTIAISSVGTMIGGLKAPTNLNDVRAFLSTLRQIINKIKQLKNQMEKIQKKLQQLQSLLASGNYLSVIIALASGGVSFFEKPTTYKAKYPYNKGWTTAGGHKFERDDTPSGERIKYSHPKGTSIDIQPDGAMVIKSPDDMQLSITKDFDVLVKDACTITVNGDAKIIADSASIEAKNDCTVSSTTRTLVISTGDVQVTAGGSAVVNSTGTATVSSALGTEVSCSGGTLTLSGKIINIISEGAITMTSTSLTETIAGPILRSAGATIKETSAIHTIKAGVINLN